MATKEEIVFELKSRQEKEALEVFLSTGRADFVSTLQKHNSKLLSDADVLENIVSQTDETKFLVEALMSNSSRTELYNKLDLDSLISDLESTINSAQELLSTIQTNSNKTAAIVQTLPSNEVKPTETELDKVYEHFYVDPMTGLINMEEIVDLIPKEVLEKEENKEKEEAEATKAGTSFVDKIFKSILNIFKKLAGIVLTGLLGIGRIFTKGITLLISSLGKLIPWALRVIGPVVLLDYLSGGFLRTAAKGIMDPNAENFREVTKEKSIDAVRSLHERFKNYDSNMSSWEAIKYGAETGIDVAKLVTHSVASEFTNAYIAVRDFFSDDSNDVSEVVPESTTPILDSDNINFIPNRNQENITPIPTINNNIQQTPIKPVIHNTLIQNNYTDIDMDFDENTGIVYVEA